MARKLLVVCEPTEKNIADLNDLFIDLTNEVEAAFVATKDMLAEFGFVPEPIGTMVQRIMFLLANTEEMARNDIKATYQKWLKQHGYQTIDDA